MSATADTLEITTDKTRIDRGLVHRFLDGTYWAAGIPSATVNRAIEHSLCFAGFEDGRQVAFARVITDHATFAYLADVFVVESHRGRGIGRRLVRAILDHPDLQGLRRWMLATLDAQGLYEPFGFSQIRHPERFMEIRQPNPYGKPTEN